MSLTEELAEFKKGFLENAPKNIQELMAKATETLENTGIAQKSPKKGDVLSAFSLPNHQGDEVALANLLKDGPVVVVFYRGGWCPYCNLELAAFQKSLADITALNASLVAITPELPDASLSTKEKNLLAFDVLTDKNAEYAKSLGLVFTLPEELRPIYLSFGIDVEKHNGSGQFDLPLAATFVIAQDGTIASAFVDTDYTLRQDPSSVIEVLKSLA
jgi:peroxiredoxin